MTLTIDIGTSFSSSAIQREDGTVTPIKAVGVSDYSVPSVAFVDDKGKLFIGHTAENLHNSNPKNYIKKFKAKFGTSWPEEYNGVTVTPEELYTEFYRLFRDSCEPTGITYDRVIATHPANWTGAQGKLTKLREILREVFVSLEDDKISLMEEPTAAMGSFPLKGVAEGDILLVYDMGGGTLDVALAESVQNNPMIIDSRGIDLGGADFDIIIYNEFIKLIQPDERTLSDVRFMNMLDQKIYAAKKCLSLHEAYIDDIPAGFEYKHIELTRSRFDELIAPLMKKSDKLLSDLLEANGYQEKDIDRILCVGGSTRVPYVIDSVERLLGKRPLVSPDPELAVCLGAAKKRTESAEEYFVQATALNEADNYDEAEKWYRKAAELGHAPAQNMMGRMYQEGYGVVRSDTESIKWFLMAAKQEDKEAQLNLGVIYHEGTGVKQDIAEAAKWYRKAAEQGQAEAQYGLGFMYQEGAGVEQNFTEAIKWYRKAAEQGQENAHQMLSNMSVSANDSESSANWSKNQAAEYAWRLIDTLKLKNFLGVRHFLPISSWKAGFEKRLPGALTYANLSFEEYPIYIYDFTVLGKSAQNGVLATMKALYFTHVDPPGTKCSWDEILSFNGFEIKTKSGEAYSIPKPINKSDQENQLKLLHQIWKDFSVPRNHATDQEPRIAIDNFEKLPKKSEIDAHIDDDDDNNDSYNDYSDDMSLVDRIHPPGTEQFFL